MQTTVSLSDDLAEDLRRRAAEEGVSVSALIESLVRAALHGAPPFRLVTETGTGIQPGIDLDCGARLSDGEDVAGGLENAGR